MVNINLLPKEYLEQKRLKRLIAFSSFIVIVCLGIFVAIYLLRTTYLTQLTFQHDRIVKELNKLQPVIEEIKQLESFKATLQARKNLVESLLTNGLCYPKFLVGLVKSLPEDLWLETLRAEAVFDSERKIKAIKANISCKCYDRFSIADFLINLEQAKKFKNVNLGSINIQQQEKYEIHSFNIEFEYILE